MNRRVFTVFRKEVKDNIRDQRSLMSSFLLPVFYPILLALIMGMTSKKVKSSKGKVVKLAVVGAEHAPAVVRHLQQLKIKVIPVKNGLRALVKKGTYKVGIKIPKDFAKTFRSAKPAKITMVVDKSRRWGKTSSLRVHRALAGYAQKIGALRLVARGIHPQVVRPIAIQTIDTATQRDYAAMLFSALPIFLMIIIFIGGLYVAIDTTAGEFERGSLEPLLVNPLTRFEFLLGKYLAVVLFATSGLLLSMFGFGLVPLLISTEALGFQIQLSPLVLAQIFLLCIPLACLASAVQMLLATFSKSFKEAQAKLSIMMMVPIVPGLMLMFLTLKPKLWAMMVPTLGEQLLINELLRGNPIPPLFFVVVYASTVFYTALSLFLANRMYQGERLFLRQ